MRCVKHAARLFCPLPLLLIAVIAKGEPAGTMPSAEAQAQTYARCMKLAKSDPVAAETLAQGWQKKGGAHPADHCAAVALIGLGKYRDGADRLDALAKAMEKAPLSLRADVLDQAAQAWLLAGEPVRAYGDATAAIGLAPNNPDLLVDRAEAAASAGYFDKAVADLDRVLKTDPHRVDALVYRASAYRALDRLDPALADIEAALKRAPDSAAALLERGDIRRLKGDLAGAHRDWEQVGKVAPGSQADMAARANIEHLALEEKAAKQR
ncbi:MAG TPA: tetratricopeptide repeat protein [Stellaceae bacterium]